ncbi:MAG TPA: ABC transporter permease subunit [Steroidobacter sp.]|uniref:ABC transporter permease n=1 Tax=Steroidobacter sp. TaxID=1978227 RepID=UPI002ED9A156
MNEAVLRLRDLMASAGISRLKLPRDFLTRLGLLLVSVAVLTALFAPVIATHDPIALDVRNRLAPPDAVHWFGTDEVGRDVFSRVVYGARYSIGVSVLVVSIAAVFGLLIGAFAGFMRGRTDAVIMRVVDVLLSIPGLVFAMALTAALGPSLMNAMLALAVVITPAYIRLVRGQALAVGRNSYVEAAVLYGASKRRILARHVIPNCYGPVLVQMTVDLGAVILAAAALSFLGLGAQPPDPEWGALIGSGRRYIQEHWWCATFPGLAIVLTAAGFNLIGDGLSDLLDPRDGHS